MQNDEHLYGHGLVHREWPIVLLLFMAFIGLYALNWHVGYFGLGMLFGDVALTAAERVQAGDIPYRDFWTMYAPGSYYLLAQLFRLFGNHYLVSTISASALSAASVCMSYLLIYDLLGSRRLALVCAGAFFAATYMAGYYQSLGPYPPVLFCVLLSLYSVARFYLLQRRVWLFAAGLATGAAIIFKHDVGGYTGIAISAGLLVAYLPRVRHPVAVSVSPVSALLVYAAAAALITAPVAVYFAMMAGADMWRDLIVFPATDFRFTRGEHYPELLPVTLAAKWWLESVFTLFYHLRFTLPFMMFLLAIAAVVIAVWKRKGQYLPLIVTFAIAYLFHYSSAHVQINTNVVSMALYGILLGAILFDQLDRQLKLRGRMVFRTAGLAFALLFITSHIAKPVYSRFFNARDYVILSLPKISGLRVLPETGDTITRLVAFVDSNVPPDMKIFVGLHRHDTVVVGDGKMYFILNRRNATRQDQLHPGIVDTVRIQNEMIRDLERNEVEYLILKHVFGDEALDRLRKISSETLPESGATMLDTHIRVNYERLQSIDSYEIWVRKRGRPFAAAM